MLNRSLALAIIVGALIIGACLLFGNRYAFAVGQNGVVWRVDRLTGQTSVCEHGDYNPFCSTAVEPKWLQPDAKKPH
jgi:hypothetical protein